VGGAESKPCTISPNFSTAVQSKLLVSQPAVHDYDFLHQDHHAYSNDLTPSNYYLFCMYVSLMYRLWKILLSNMPKSETFGMTLVLTYACLLICRCSNRPLYGSCLSVCLSVCHVLQLENLLQRENEKWRNTKFGVNLARRRCNRCASFQPKS